MRVGLTGGLASGKSFVGDALAGLGCRLMKADEVGHTLLMPGGAAHQPVIQAFGEGVLDAEGAISRQRLSELVFAHPERLAELNGIIHPLVFAEEDRFFETIEAEDPGAIAVVEAAILIETGNFRRFEKLVVAWCPRAMQIARAIHRGMTEQQALARLAHQMPLDDKLAYADFVVDTSGDKADTRRRVELLYQQLREVQQQR